MHEIASLGHWLKIRRVALQLTQAELASRVGCAAVTIRKIEADERRPSAQIAELLAQHLELAPDERMAFLQAAQELISPLRLAAAPTEAAAQNTQRGSLPIAPTALIGRAAEIAAVRGLLRRADVRLLTLTGPGGVGKTRLALEAGRNAQSAFSDGVWFVPLAPISEPALLLSAIAQTLGTQELSGQALQQTVLAALRDRQILLVLDNFEQIHAAAVQLAELLAELPALKLLVTSRIPLRIAAEHQFPVPPLALPDAQMADATEAQGSSEAVTLFVTRAQAVKGDFAITAANAPVIAAICARLDGLPLAIELAVRRSKFFSPTVLLSRLENRLGTLTDGARDQPARQQTLRATIDWSYHLLSPAEQQLFARLAVFVGSWTLAAAVRVCAATVSREDMEAGIASLLDQSLLQEDQQFRDAEDQRFMMLETIREYALEMLATSGEADAVHSRHAAHFLTLTETAAPHLLGSEQRLWFARLDHEWENIRAALAFLLRENRIIEGLRLATALHSAWIRRRALSEGRQWLEALLAQAEHEPLPDAMYAQALLVIGDLARYQEDVDAAVPSLEQALQHFTAASEHRGAAEALHSLGWVLWMRGDVARSVEIFDQSLTLYRELGDTHGIATTLIPRSYLVAHWDGHFDQALPLGEESLRLFRETGDLRRIATALRFMGWLVHDLGNLEQGAQFVDEALVLTRELEDKPELMDTLSDRAMIAARLGDFARAEQLFGEQLALSRRLGHTGGVSSALGGLAMVARYQGQFDHAQSLLEEARKLDQHSAVPFNTGVRGLIYGAVAYDQGNVAQAARLYRDSLAIFRSMKAKWDCTACIEGLASVASAEGDAARAVRLWGSAAASRAALHAPLPPVDRPRRDAMLAELRRTLGDAAFEALWAEGQALTLEAAVAEAMA